MNSPVILDWTSGGQGLRYQQCCQCGHRWTFSRDFCPACGSREVDAKPSSGRGVVEAATTIHRAPLEALRSFAPYRVVLVRTDENLRFMGHAREHDLHIDERVQVSFAPFGELAFIPIFSRRA